jgi:hypothetical protein
MEEEYAVHVGADGYTPEIVYRVSTLEEATEMLLDELVPYLEWAEGVVSIDYHNEEGQLPHFRVNRNGELLPIFGTITKCN